MIPTTILWLSFYSITVYEHMYSNNNKKVNMKTQHTKTQCKHERDTGVRGSPHPRGYVHQSLCYINSFSVVFTSSRHILCPNSPLRILPSSYFSFVQVPPCIFYKISKLYKSIGISWDRCWYILCRTRTSPGYNKNVPAIISRIPVLLYNFWYLKKYARRNLQRRKE